jgi:putative pyruvate formate lyase activating enzyme
MMEGLIEVYMPDMRYGDENAAECYSSAPNYPEINRATIAEMHRQVGDLQTNENDVATRGLLIRHLVLPNNLSRSEEIFKFISEKISPNTYISLMSQYFPAFRAHEYPQISRRITKKEYAIAKRSMEKYNLSNGWFQDEIL